MKPALTPAPSFFARIFRLAVKAATTVEEGSHGRPEWINGKRAPVRRKFARHQASCFEMPPSAYGSYSPHHFE
ncbi:MAG: hypothetical protein EOP11_12105 [Proteobacteria bacterium]|nr:MAG: hypothetical protein EOP11_12105 [Pseudomonadota bacterium]